jgi:hypothetical protein
MVAARAIPVRLSWSAKQTNKSHKYCGEKSRIACDAVQQKGRPGRGRPIATTVAAIG